MSKAFISQTYLQTLQLQNLKNTIAQSESRTHLKGLVGSSFSIVIAESFKTAEKPFLVVFDDKEEAAYYLNDLEQLINDKDVLFYPGSYRRPYQIEETNNANVLLRAEVLNRINSRKKPCIIVTYPDALFEKVVTKMNAKAAMIIKLKTSSGFFSRVLCTLKLVDFRSLNRHSIENLSV